MVEQATTRTDEDETDGDWASRSFLHTIERALQHGDVGILYERNDHPRSPFVEIHRVPDVPSEDGYERIDTANPRDVRALMQDHLRSLSRRCFLNAGRSSGPAL